MRILPVILFLIGSVVDSVMITHITVPSHASFGKSLTLYCVFEFNKGEHLYSVKWYKDNEEFFRYIPRFKPQILVHNVEGVHVDLEKSSHQKVTLNRVEMRTSGSYRCEVSAEAPSFSSDQKEGRLTVVYLPTEGPQITGNLKDEYEVGEILDLNCISSKSYPPAKISWYINESPIKDTWVSRTNEEEGERYVNMTIVENHLYTTQLRLRMILQPQHFRPSGIAKIKCKATITTTTHSRTVEPTPIPGKAYKDPLFPHIHDHLHTAHHTAFMDERETSLTVRSDGSSLSTLTSLTTASLLSTLILIGYHF